METGLYSYLISKTAITALVATRIYPLIAPEGAAYPFLIYQRISTQHEHNMAGSSGLATATVQLDAYSDTYAEAKSIGNAIRTALDGYRGSMGGTFVSRCHIGDERDLLDITNVADEFGSFRWSADFKIAYHESIPTFS
jgi:hypothetical protein